MFLLNCFTVAVFVAFALPSHAAELEAPAGLQWGHTRDQIKANGGNIYGCRHPRDKNDFEECNIHKPPKPLSFARYYKLRFYRGLQSVEMSHYNKLDTDGASGEQIYTDLMGRLTAKYGDPTKVTGLPRETLNSIGANYIRWSAIWNIGDAKINLELFWYAGKSSIDLTYYSKDYKHLEGQLQRTQEAQRAKDAAIQAENDATGL